MSFKSLFNKKVRHEYNIIDTLEAGIVLSGPEVKSIRMGRAQLSDAHVRIIDNQAVLIGMSIQPYPNARQEEYDPKRTRNLLLHRKQINKLIGTLEQKKLTLVPIKLYQTRNRFKLELGVAKGKQEFEKRESKKKISLV